MTATTLSHTTDTIDSSVDWWATQLATYTGHPDPDRNANSTASSIRFSYATDLLNVWRTIRYQTFTGTTRNPKTTTLWTGPESLYQALQPDTPSHNNPGRSANSAADLATADGIYLISPWTPETLDTADHLHRICYLTTDGNGLIRQLVRDTIASLNVTAPGAIASGFAAAYLTNHRKLAGNEAFNAHQIVGDIATHWNP